MVVARQILTVADVVKEFLAVSGYKPKDPFRFLAKVCRRWNCLPNYDGTALRAHLLANMGVSLESAIAIQDDAFSNVYTEDGARWDGAVWSCLVNRDADMSRDTGNAFWHEVGRGTNPIRFLTRPHGTNLRSASVAMQEHYGRK